MKEIECPACGEMIPDDSKYCEMCGAELLECINCGALGTGQFCAECGKPMVSRSDKAPEKAEKDPAPDPPADPDPGDDGHGTTRKKLVLKARKSNVILTPQHEAIIGRKGSPYQVLLEPLDLISRRHGQFLKKGRDWYILDFGSTNGTFVNDNELEPDVPVKISKGDVVDIGTYIFDVIEQ